MLSLLLLLGTSLVVQAQTIRYVRTDGPNANPATATTWANSTANLQGAINASAAGDQVWVAAGTYKPGGDANSNRNVSFSMKNGVAIYGGFAGTEGNLSQRVPANALATILSGDIGIVGNSADNSYTVISNPRGLTNSAVLDGFLITGGTGVNNSGGCTIMVLAIMVVPVAAASCAAPRCGTARFRAIRLSMGPGPWTMTGPMPALVVQC